MSRFQLRLELEELCARYARAVTPEHLEEWPGLFEERCLYAVRTRENAERNLPIALMHCESRGMLEDRVAAIRRTALYAPRAVRTLISGLIIDQAMPDRVAFQASFIVVHTLPDEEPKLLASGVYHDVAVRGETGWRFVEKQCVLDGNLVPVPGSVVFPI